LLGLAKGFFNDILDGIFDGLSLGSAEGFFEGILYAFFDGILLGLVDGFFLGFQKASLMAPWMFSLKASG
jgi:hypothetical protein